MNKKVRMDQADGLRSPDKTQSPNEEERDLYYDEDEVEEFTDNLEGFSRDQYNDLYQLEDVDHHFLLTFRDSR